MLQAIVIKSWKKHLTKPQLYVAQSTEAVEYTDYISAMG